LCGHCLTRYIGNDNEGNSAGHASAADYDIYYHHLLASQKGSPMWIPGPDLNLPVRYRKDGIRFGDVGILYRAEGFHFLFNIFYHATHAINKERVPDGFEHLDNSGLKLARKKRAIGKGQYFTNLSQEPNNKSPSVYLIKGRMLIKC